MAAAIDSIFNHLWYQSAIFFDIDSVIDVRWNVYSFLQLPHSFNRLHGSFPTPQPQDIFARCMRNFGKLSGTGRYRELQSFRKENRVAQSLRVMKASSQKAGKAMPGPGSGNSKCKTSQMLSQHHFTSCFQIPPVSL